MPVITSIKQQKNKNRVSVYLDDKYGFGIDLDNFVILKLKVGQELTDSEVEKAVKTAEYQKTLDKLLRFAMVRPRSEKEVTDYFRRKKASGPGGPLALRVHPSLIPELLEKLRHLELIDDLKFAQWWVDQRANFKPKTKRILKIELTKKGIVKEIINTVLDDTPIDEKKMAQDLLTRKAYKWKNMEPREAKQKKSQYLAGKGFSWDVIEQAVKDVDD